MSAAIEEAVRRADTDELWRFAGRLTDSADWDGLFALRDACRDAAATGRQLWAAAARCDYLAALRAPAAYAVRVLVDRAGRLAPGPLAEVAASTHTWAELAGLLVPGPVAVMVAHERVVRGEDLTGTALPGPDPLEVPLVLAPWEPAYPLATYHDDGTVDVDRPRLPDLAGAPGTVLPRPGGGVADHDTVEALCALARAWVTESNGRAQAVGVEGTAAAAVAALGCRRARMVALAPTEALAWMAWAAASGGAHGRRRGAAAGRFGAWWALACLGGPDDDWPPDTAELGQLAGELAWYRWDAFEPDLGWGLQLAVEDPDEGLAWAVAAYDAV